MLATAIAAQCQEQTGRFTYFMQILGQTYVNEGRFDLAMALFQTALAFAEADRYIQIQDRILTGMAEIYRNGNDFEPALASHANAIDLLERIGAKCDLAEALFQQGIIYRAMSDASTSQANFVKAMELFQIVKASLQVQK
jgi:tetratricopeptide (TPR) repeat protein